MVHHDRIRGRGTCDFKAVPHVASVRADLADFIKPAKWNPGRVGLARHPDCAILYQPDCASQQIGSGELDAGPLSTNQL